MRLAFQEVIPGRAFLCDVVARCSCTPRDSTVDVPDPEDAACDTEEQGSRCLQCKKTGVARRSTLQTPNSTLHANLRMSLPEYMPEDPPAFGRLRQSLFVSRTSGGISKEKDNVAFSEAVKAHMPMCVGMLGVRSLRVPSAGWE